MNINYREPTIVNSQIHVLYASFMQKAIVRLNLIVKQCWVFIAFKVKGERENTGPSENVLVLVQAQI